MNRSHPTVGNLGPAGAAVKVQVQERRGRRRGLAALRRLDEIEATLLAADDPLERDALVHLHDRVARLTLRGAFGVRGLW